MRSITTTDTSVALIIAKNGVTLSRFIRFTEPLVMLAGTIADLID